MGRLISRGSYMTPPTAGSMFPASQSSRNIEECQNSVSLPVKLNAETSLYLRSTIKLNLN